MTVSDTGVGIEPEVLKQIFDPFFSTRKVGSGLGLAVVHSIVKKHGGHISVDSIPGRGTSFRLHLPATGVAVGVIEGEVESIAGAQNLRGSALVLDDDEMVRNVLSDMLGILGFQVESVSNGEAAIQRYKESLDAGRRFSVVILDLTIPGGMGGKEVIKKLLELDEEVVAIASSGYAIDAVMANHTPYGFKGALVKPYTTEQLEEVLGQVMGKSDVELTVS